MTTPMVMLHLTEGLAHNGADTRHRADSAQQRTLFALGGCPGRCTFGEITDSSQLLMIICSFFLLAAGYRGQGLTETSSPHCTRATLAGAL